METFKELLYELKTAEKNLNEGGAFGHLSHPFDKESDFTFSELKQFIKDALKGKLDYVEEKTDAANLMFSYKNGTVISARNKSHLKNFGENAMTPSQLKAKFEVRDIGIAYGAAIDDLTVAFSKLSEKQKMKIFDEGRHWMSAEIMAPQTENVISYDLFEIRLHGTIEHDENGIAVGTINKKNASMLEGMLKQRNAQNQSTFNIKNLSKVKLYINKDYKNMNAKYSKMLSSIQKKYNLKDSDKIVNLLINHWEKLLTAKTKDKALIELLIKRFALYDKSYSISKIKKEYSKDAKWIVDFDKKSQSINKDIKLEIEKIFLSLGGEILSQMSNFMALNPDKAVRKTQAKIDKAIEKIKSSGDVKMLQKMAIELDRLNSGGKILPTEGITFFYKGRFLKLTGSFAPTNQLIGMLYRLDN